MKLKTENFFKNRVLNSRISIVFVTTVSVLIMGILGSILINYNSLENTLKENISFNLIIKDSVEELELQQLIKSLNLTPHIKSVHFYSKDVASKNFINNLGENFMEVLEENPLPNIIEIRYHADYISNVNQLEQKNIFLAYDQIEDVIYDENIISILEDNFKKVSFILFVLTLIFFVVAFILINSNIRLTIYAKRFSIKTMQLVGATKKFIQTPFLISNLKSGLLACILGNMVLLGLFVLIKKEIPEIINYISVNQIIILLLLTSLINLTITFFSVLICVRKYLNLNTEDLYK